MHAAKPKDLPPGMSKPRTASPKYVSAAYGISVSLIYTLMKDGNIRSTTVGGRRLIFLDSVDAMLEAKASGGNAA